MQLPPPDWPAPSRLLPRLGVPALATVLMAAAAGPAAAQACSSPVAVCASDPGRGFGLVRGGRPVAVLVEPDADPAVRHVARSFADDLERVAGQPARLLNALPPAGTAKELVIIGAAGRSPLIDSLVAQGRLRADDLTGRWEAYRQAVVERPFPGVERALVVAGADRRGAVFGTYDLSQKIGVSPWHWWADVPTTRRSEVFIAPGERRDEPGVKYRGFFINDEDPSFKTWALNRYGGLNAQMYATVFELLLRLKGNTLWPAMWPPKAFNDDDPMNAVLADEMGVVMGTSHHEPMMRAHDEWYRVKGGAWDYTRNGETLREFWRGGIARMHGKPAGGAHESLVTIGMRGDGDEPMAEGTAVGLLERIVADQRRIIAEVSGRPAEKTPQVWALYKEVQDYFDQGMQVPDDVLLLFADDNWGQLRRLPDAGPRRRGGHGVYYHFDYVGGPRNYKWLNTTQIQKTWQQMNLAHAHGVDALWIVNVGDIKPMEFPISFFLDMAWNPAGMTLEAMNSYTARWSAQTFGADLADEVASLIDAASQIAARRKPELLDPDSHALGAIGADRLDGGDFGWRVAEWDALERRAEILKRRLRPEQHAAFHQLVEHPILALGNLYRLYYYTAWNRRLAALGDARANAFADLALAAFRRDEAITAGYHAQAGGKWAGMMLQTHIGYTRWQQPSRNIMPATQRVAAAASPSAETVLQQLQHVVPGPAAGAIVIEATAFQRSVPGRGLAWTAIPQLGHGTGAVTALPQGRPATEVADGVRAEYGFETALAGDVRLELVLVPTLDTGRRGGVRLGVSVDEGPVQVLALDLQPATGAERNTAERDWSKAVRDNAFVLTARFEALPAGRHVLKLWRLDDNAVVQRLMLHTAAATTGAR